MRCRHGDGIDLEAGIVDGIEDKVTQDIDNSEGTGVWSFRALWVVSSVP
jgi:6-phosphogluconate dehydrogenase